MDQPVTKPVTKPESIPFRNGCVTWYTDKRPTELWDDKLKYVAYGVETCPTTQRIHLQMWAACHKPQRLSGWKKLFPGAHIEQMFGSLEQNDKYCSKESELVVMGQKPNPNGVSSKFLEVKQKVDDGQEVMDIACEPEFFETVIRYRHGFQSYERHVRKKTKQEDRTMPDVYIRIGPAGTGKTRWMDEKFGLSGWIMAPDNTGQWFDGCDKDVILFDDVDAKSIMSLSKFKRLTDRYPLQVPVKGGFITWKPKVIVFTSNCHPNLWWDDLTYNDQMAIERRCKEIIVVE